MGCEMLDQSDVQNSVIVKSSMAQLAAIKSLNCVEKVEMADKPYIIKNKADSADGFREVAEASEITERVSVMRMENDVIAPMCYDDGSGSDGDHSNTMQTAYHLPLVTWMKGDICCPCAECWYMFTASASSTAEYTIYTSGSLDTIGYLYNSNGRSIL